jgi:hypothetical protein
MDEEEEDSSICKVHTSIWISIDFEEVRKEKMLRTNTWKE